MPKTDQTYIVFTDGSSRGNPGPGGWAAIVIENGDKLTELGGRVEHTTNNRMELEAALRALEFLPEQAVVTIHTDSSYLISGMTKWVAGWKRNGWQTSTKIEVLNRDLWSALDRVAASRNVHFQYVGGHRGVLGNERCDHIATDLADGEQHKLFSGRLKDYDLPNILDVSQNETIAENKKTDSARHRAAAYSYVSMVGGIIETHHTWPECERRVRGVAGAKYKKSLNQADEQKIIEEFGAF